MKVDTRVDKFNAIKHLVQLFNIPFAKARRVLENNDWNLMMAIADLQDDL